MKKTLFCALTALTVLTSAFCQELTPPSITPIPIDEFKDLIHHGVMKFPESTPPYPRWTEADVLEIADNILTFQNPDGGWGKIGRSSIFKNFPGHEKASCQDLLIKLAPEEKELMKAYLLKVQPVKFDSIKTEGSTKPSEKISKPRSVLDNRMTYSHVRYLIKVYNQTKEEKYLESAARGLHWILSVELPCGGWSGCDVYGLCINDDVTSGVLSFLQDMLYESEYEVLLNATDPLTGKPFEEAVIKAHDRAIAVLLKTQVKVKGRKTVWAHNYDPDTLKPIAARPFEPAALTALESVPVVETLLREKNLTPEIKACIKAAVEFLCSDKIYTTGWIEKRPVEQFEEGGRWYNYEKIFHPGNKKAPGPNDQKLLIRYISIKDFKPLYGDWTGKVYEDFNQLPRERRNGYGFLSTYKEDEFLQLKEKAGSL